MSDEPVKAEFVVRVEQLMDVAKAENELQSAATAFANAEYEAVRAAERLIEWAQVWQEGRAKVLSPELAALTPEQATFYGRGNHLANARALMALFCDRVRIENGGPTGGGDDGGTISLDRSEFTGHPNAPDEGGPSAASFDLGSLSPDERKEMQDRAVGDEAEQARAVQAFEEQEATDYEAVRDRAGEVEISPSLSLAYSVDAPLARDPVKGWQEFYQGALAQGNDDEGAREIADFYWAYPIEVAEQRAAARSTLQVVAAETKQPEQDAGGYAPVTEADEQNSVYGTEAAYNDGVEARIQNIPVECNPCEGADAAAWADGWAEADDTITLAELDNESADILTDPDLQAKADEMRATLAAGTLVDAELDAALDAARKREGAESRSFWPFGGKLVGA